RQPVGRGPPRSPREPRRSPRAAPQRPTGIGGGPGRRRPAARPRPPRAPPPPLPPRARAAPGGGVAPPLRLLPALVEETALTPAGEARGGPASRDRGRATAPRDGTA